MESSRIISTGTQSWDGTDGGVFMIGSQSGTNVLSGITLVLGIKKSYACPHDFLWLSQQSRHPISL